MWESDFNFRIDTDTVSKKNTISERTEVPAGGVL